MFAPVDPNHPVISKFEVLGTELENILVKDSLPKQSLKTNSAVGSGSDIKQDLETKGIIWSDFVEELEENSSSISSNTWDSNQICKVCHERRADACIVHQHPDSHNCVCYPCALQYFRESRTCPLCAKDIVYIYVYQDI